jgi:hypothetical protein
MAAGGVICMISHHHRDRQQGGGGDRHPLTTTQSCQLRRTRPRLHIIEPRLAATPHRHTGYARTRTGDPRPTTRRRYTTINTGGVLTCANAQAGAVRAKILVTV